MSSYICIYICTYVYLYIPNYSFTLSLVKVLHAFQNKIQSNWTFSVFFSKLIFPLVFSNVQYFSLTSDQKKDKK